MLNAKIAADLRVLASRLPSSTDSDGGKTALRGLADAWAAKFRGISYAHPGVVRNPERPLDAYVEIHQARGAEVRHRAFKLRFEIPDRADRAGSCGGRELLGRPAGGARAGSRADGVGGVDGVSGASRRG